MQTVSYNDLTKRARNIVLALAKQGKPVYVSPARRGWMFHPEQTSGTYPVVDIPVNGVTQETVILSQEAQDWIKAMKEMLPVLTESEIVCAALQHYALYLKNRQEENALFEIADDPLFTSEEAGAGFGNNQSPYATKGW